MGLLLDGVLDPNTPTLPYDVLYVHDPDRKAVAFVFDTDQRIGLASVATEFETTLLGGLRRVLLTSFFGKPEIRIHLDPQALAQLHRELGRVNDAVRSAGGNVGAIADHALRNGASVARRVDSGNVRLVEADPDDVRYRTAMPFIDELAAAPGNLVRELDAEAMGHGEHPHRVPTLEGHEVRELADQLGYTVVYTDGSRCLDGHREAAAVAWWVDETEHDAKVVKVGHGISALERFGAIEAIAAQPPDRKIALVHDCESVHRAMLGHDRLPFAKQLRDAVRDRGVLLFHVKGHQDPDGHNHVDRLARATARAALRANSPR